MHQKGTAIELISTSANRKALLLSCGAMTFQQMSGINVVLFYSEEIFRSAGKTFLSASDSTIVLGVTLIATAGIAMPLTKVYGMKNMLIVSALGMVVFQVRHTHMCRLSGVNLVVQIIKNMTLGDICFLIITR